MAERNWQPNLTIESLKKRAQLLTATRAFFSARKVCEVQTPLLASAGNPDPHIDTMAVNLSAGGYSREQGYLNSSPEFCMKRLLAAGSGDIYQLCSAFRAGEAGRWHNPEFTILEWYRLDFSMRALMDEVADLLASLAQQSFKPIYKTWQQVWDEVALDVDDASALTGALEQQKFDVPMGLDLSELQDLAFSLLVQPGLGHQGLCFVYHYPAAQASLARLCPTDATVAERFELFWQGVELANGFVELVNANEQRDRFVANNAARVAAGKPELPIDELLLQALKHGLPDCAGVAVGFDRLAALLMQKPRLEAAMSFSALRS